MGKYYDGTKLLSMKDINGNKPEIYICTSNRSAGKTTYFGRMLVKRFLQHGDKFMLVYRYAYELDSVADKFFKDIGDLFFPEYTMDGIARAKGMFYELALVPASCTSTRDSEREEERLYCGYAVSINTADNVKKYSHFFSDTKAMLFDEFQSETNHYCSNEIEKFYSVHTSVARGHGSQTRYLPVYMLSNPVSIVNPYYVVLDIATRLRSDTKFLRGDGYVLEQGYNESSRIAQEKSAFNRAFNKSSYGMYSSQGVYLDDNTAFIGKPSGKSGYLCTIRDGGVDYGVRVFYDDGIYYCDNTPDKTASVQITCYPDDHRAGYQLMTRNDPLITNMRAMFDYGRFRFKNSLCKNAILHALYY